MYGTGVPNRLDAAPLAPPAARTAEGLLNRLPLIMWATDTELRLLWIRGGAIRMLGLDQLCAIGMALEGVFGTPDHPVIEHHRRALGGETQTLEAEWMDRSYEVWIEPVYDAGTITGSMAIARDITESKRAERMMMVQSTLDPLTGALNRMRLCEATDTILQQARRHSAEVAAVFIDVDGFSSINDSFGASAADALLRAVHRRISEVVPGGAIIGRAGSDEFAVVFIKTSDSLDDFCRHLQRRLTEPFSIADKALHVGVSIGTALFPKDGASVDRLLACAAAASHHAGDNGGGRSQDFSPALTFANRQRLQIESDLREALDRKEFFLVYQPQVRIHDGSIAGAEVLLRWQKNGDILPAWSFIRYAEESAVIVPIGEWVIDTAFGQLREWRNRGLDPGRIAINFGARQLADSSIVTTIRRAIDKHGVPPGSVDIEITETAAMENIEATIRLLEDLRALGVEISIDDFGTGYSSLSYLKRFAITGLKIDRSFIADITESDTASGIVRAIVATAGILGIRVTAEGVETEQQAAILRSHGCTEAQGFMFSRPLTADGMTAYLESHGSAASRTRRKRRATG